MKKTYEFDNKLYDAYVHSIGLGMIEVTFYEVIRPNRKWFGRTKFFPWDSGVAFLKDNETTIDECIRIIFAERLAKHEAENRIIKMWEEFEKSIDKSVKV